MKDVILVVVSALAGLLLGFIPAWYYWRKRPRHGLDWALTASAAVLSPSVRAASPSLNVSVEDPANADGRPRNLEHPQLTLLRIFNAGSDAIPTQDGIKEPGIMVRHPNNEIVSISVSRAHDDVDVFRDVVVAASEPPRRDTAYVRLNGPFDRGWWFDLQIISDGVGGAPAIDATIIGATRKHMRRLDQDYVRKARRWTDRLFGVSVLAFIALAFGGGLLESTLGLRTSYTRRMADVGTQHSTSFGRISTPIWLVLLLLSTLAALVISCVQVANWIADRRVRRFTRPFKTPEDPAPSATRPGDD